MQEFEVSNHKIKFYSSAEELPIKRYSRFQKYSLIESGVGSTIEAIGVHFGKLFEYQVHKLHDQALQETKNLYYNLFLVLQELNIPGFAFCCLVHSIDGKEIEDFTEENLKKVIDQLNDIGLTQEVVLEKVGTVKKKSFQS